MRPDIKEGGCTRAWVTTGPIGGESIREAGEEADTMLAGRLKAEKSWRPRRIAAALLMLCNSRLRPPSTSQQNGNSQGGALLLPPRMRYT